MLSFLKTILIVSLVTVLVWVFAESETLREEKFPATLTLVSTDQSAGDLRLASGERSLTVDVVLAAQAVRLENARRALREAIELAPGQPGMPGATGEHSLDLASVLRASPTLRELGVSVRAVEPASVLVVIDELVTRELPVTVQVAAGQLQSPPLALPPTAKITLPRAQERNLAPGEGILATITDTQLARLVPGRTETISAVRLMPPLSITDQSRVTIAPATADVQITIRSRLGEIILPRVPVQLLLAPGEADRWIIDIPEEERTLLNVRVTGPAELIRAIEEGTAPVVGTLALSFDELERGITQKEVSFESLPGSPLRFDVADRTVTFSVRRR